MNDQRRGAEERSSERVVEAKERDPRVDRLTSRELRILFPEATELYNLTYEQKLQRLEEGLEEGNFVYDEYKEIQPANYYRLTEEGLRERRRTLAENKRLETLGRISQAFPRW